MTAFPRLLTFIVLVAFSAPSPAYCAPSILDEATSGLKDDDHASAKAPGRKAVSPPPQREEIRSDQEKTLSGPPVKGRPRKEKPPPDPPGKGRPPKEKPSSGPTTKGRAPREKPSERTGGNKNPKDSPRDYPDHEPEPPPPDPDPVGDAEVYVEFGFDFDTGFSPEEAALWMTSLSIVASTISVLRGESSGSAASAGFTAGYFSLMSVTENEARYKSANVIAGAAAILLGILNVSMNN